MLNDNRIKSIDFLKGLAIIGVITLHSFVNYGPFEVVLRQSVPIFLILIGLNGAMSLDRSGFDIREYFKSRVSRLVLPLIPVLLITTALAVYFSWPFFTRCYQYPSYFLLLGQMPVYGPGNYFVGVILQAVLILPLLWWTSKKDMRLILAGSFGVSLIYSILYQYYLPHNPYLNELVIFGWLFALAIGIALVDIISSKTVSFPWQAGISVSTGLAIFLAFLHPEYMNSIFNLEGSLTFLFTAGIVIAVILAGISWSPIDLLGKASYHIFLAQMVYFIIFNLGYLPNLTITISAGLLFYFAGNELKKLCIAPDIERRASY